MINNFSDQTEDKLVSALNNQIMQNWNESVANGLAEAEGIKLTEAHFEVLDYLRRCYDRFGQISHARSLTQALETRFATRGGKKFLYTLFPKGPVFQGCIVAGIPAPKDYIDTSFGTAA